MMTYTSVSESLTTVTKSRHDNNKMAIKDTGKDVSVKGKWAK